MFFFFRERDRSRTTRARSSKRDKNLAFPCPDCKQRSFDTEAGLYAHRLLFKRCLMKIKNSLPPRILACGLRGKEKPTSLDFKCASCLRAFTTPIGLATHRFTRQVNFFVPIREGFLNPSHGNRPSFQPIFSLSFSVCYGGEVPPLSANFFRYFFCKYPSAILSFCC